MGIFNTFYDHGILTKYTLAFGSLFKDMVLRRKNSNGTEFERYTIPLTYSPKEKYIQRVLSDPELLQKNKILFPRMAYELTGISYDPGRNLNNKQLMGVFNATDPNNKLAFYTPAPYNMAFNLYITTKTIGEMLQIIEQILPAFRPDYKIAVKLLADNTMADDPNANVSSISLDVPISLINEYGQDTYEGSIEDDRTIVWTLQFLVKGYLFGPIKNLPIIKQTQFTTHPISEIDVDDDDKITHSTITATVIVDGKTLEEIFETDDWDIEYIFSWGIIWLTMIN